MTNNPSLASLFGTFLKCYTQINPILAKILPKELHPIRKQALQAFKKNRLPSPKTEAYRYTPFLHHLHNHFKQQNQLTTAQTTSTLSPPILQKIDAHPITLYNGLSLSHQSLPKGLTLLPFSKAYPLYKKQINTYFAKLALPEQDSFVALNTLLLSQAHFLYLEPETQLEKPLILHHLAQSNTGATSHPRLLILLGKHSKLQLIETFCHFEKKPIFTNRVAEIILDSHAQLDHYQLQPQNLSPHLQMHYTYIHQKASSTLHHHTFTLDGQLTRNHLEVSLSEPQSKASLYGLYTADDQNHLENNTLINHQAPHTTSQQHYKGIAQQAGTGIFRGTIQVQKSAQKTSASQKHHAWLLDPRARIKAQPRLAIQADDVQCSHGATISQPDENQLFYLQTRGIHPKEAYKLLLQGFYHELIKSIKIVSLQHYLNQTLTNSI